MLTLILLRLNKLEEVEILWGIGDSPHCVKLVNAWVQYGYLYLQMELCAAGRYELSYIFIVTESCELTLFSPAYMPI